jgi:IS605 OrfB family transposase
MPTTQTYTYQGRLHGEYPALDRYAELFGRLERKLYVDRVFRKTDLNVLKSRYIATYGISARQFNALRIQVDGKISSVLALLALAAEEYRQRIAKKTAQVERLYEKISKENAFLTHGAMPESRLAHARRMLSQYYFRLHHSKRKLASLISRLAGIEQRLKDGNPKICFGSKELFRKQFGLDKTSDSYDADFEAWHSAWVLARNNVIYVVGSKDEVCGNASCQLTSLNDEAFNLKLRLPDSLSNGFGKHFTASVQIAYGAENIRKALDASHIINGTTIKKSGEKVSVRKRTGVALTYRFHKDTKGWRVLVSTPVEHGDETTSAELGVLGVDINADHLAISETDRFGNLVEIKRINLYLNNKSSEQRQAIIGDAAKVVVTWAAAAKKPIALEILDFSVKKRELSDSKDSKYNRMLSSLAYSQIQNMLSARAVREGVGVLRVNPAFTSVIGAVNYAKRHGISRHLGAALAIARRAKHFREDLMIDRAGCFTAPRRDNTYVTLVPPVRKRTRHVWALWSQVNTLIKRPLAEGGQCLNRRAPLHNSNDDIKLPTKDTRLYPADITARSANTLNDQV